MLPNLTKIKGVHPGAVLKRELKVQGLKANQLAISINEHKQTISAILHKRRDVNPKLSIKLSKYFNTEEDYFMLLQASYNVKKLLDAESKPAPNIRNFRRVLFWDTSFDKIDWAKNKSAIIKRVLERGNEKEIKEIISFYGISEISSVVKLMKENVLPTFKKNVEIYNL